MKIKLTKKNIVIIIAVLILIYGGYRIFIKKPEQEFILEKVSLGTVLQEVSETGTVKRSEEINLGFKTTGRIENIYVKVGDEVKMGQNLVKLDTSQLSIQLQEARAALQVAEADYDKLLAGSSGEEIKISETAVLNAQVDLDNASQNLKDVEADAEEDLENAYEDALIDLQDAYLKVYNAYNSALLIQRTYFSSSDQESIKVKGKAELIKTDLDKVNVLVDTVQNSGSRKDIDTALSETRELLLEISNALELIRDMTESPNYRNTVSSTDKTSLDTHKTNINTALTNVIVAQQDISTTKITNETNINTAKATVFSSEAKLLKAQDELAFKKAGPQQENISLYQAKVKQAEAKVLLLQTQIYEAIIKSPNDGHITEINKRVGEAVQAVESVMSFLPIGPFQITTDIYEEDIVNIKVENPVDIFLAAFPDQRLKGKVVSINPAEKLISDVVYYEITIDFLEQIEGIKPGMTADVLIFTDKKENVLVVPEEAVEIENGSATVKVLKKNYPEEKEIEIGLRGSNDLIEVISGLEEGEDIILKILNNK